MISRVFSYTKKKDKMEGHIVTVVISKEDDLERIVKHHSLTQISIPSVGLEFCSERTANSEIPLFMLLQLAAQDVRENAQQMVNVESEDRDATSQSLLKFFSDMDDLSTKFPWTLQLKCPMCIASVEEGEESDVKVEKYLIDPADSERVSAAFAELAFQQADREEFGE